MQSICILDGDQSSKKNYNKNIITLPGGESPEKLIMNYSIQLLDNDDDSFWKCKTILDLNYGKLNYVRNIRPDIDEITQKLQELKEKGESIHGVERELRKNIFKNTNDSLSCFLSIGSIIPKMKI